LVFPCAVFLMLLGLLVCGALLAPLCIALLVWFSTAVQSAIVFGFIVNWPPYDKGDLSRPSASWVQRAARMLGLADSGTVGPFQGLTLAKPVSIPSPNGVVSGLRIKPAAPSRTVVYLHGQSGNIVVRHRVELYDLLSSRLGCEVIAIDYCGCGYSDFCWPSEASSVADVLATLRSVPDQEVIIWGHSLGSGVALAALEALLEEGGRVGGVVLEAPFVSLAAAAASLFLPEAWVSTRQGLERRIRESFGDFQFDSARRIRAVASKVPVMILHGKGDGKVPYSQGLRLSQIGEVPLHSFSCDHSDIVKQPSLLPLLQDVFGRW